MQPKNVTSRSSYVKRNPVVIAAVSFMAGILMDRLFDISPRSSLIVLMPSLIASLILALRYPRYVAAASILVVISTGAIYHHHRIHFYPNDHVINFIHEDRSITRVQGTVITPPVTKEGFNPFAFSAPRQSTGSVKEKLTFLLRVHKMWTGGGWHKASGAVRLTLYLDGMSDNGGGNSSGFSMQRHDTFKYGDELEVVGRLFRPHPPSNPGQFDYQQYLVNYQPPVRALMSVANIENVTLLSHGNGNPVFRFVYSLRGRLLDTIHKLSPRDEPSLISSLLLGERDAVAADVMDKFVKTGTIHFLAISGLHLGILVVSAHFIFLLTGVNRKVAAAVIIAVVVLYAILTGMKPPVLRAGIMVAVYYGAVILDRRWNIASSVSVAALLVLCRNPAALFSVSFQLSFVALLAIIYLSSRIESALHISKDSLAERLADNDGRYDIRGYITAYCRKSISVSLAAWLGVAPIVAYYFHIIAPVSILLNIIMFPLVWIILVAGFVSLMLGSIFIYLAVPFAWVASMADFLVVKTVSLFVIDDISFFYTSGLSVVWMLVYYTFGIAVTIAARYGIKEFTPVRMAMAGLLICSLYVYSNLPSHKEELRITSLDVGHGSATFFEFPNGKTMLFDVGTRSRYDVGRSVVAPFLWMSGIRKIDVVVISHEDSDHWSGLPSILERFDVDVMFTNHRFPLSTIGARLIEMAEMRGVRTVIVGRGERIGGFGDVEITVLNPRRDSDLPSQLSTNDTSMVLQVKWSGYSILSCADIEESGISAILANTEDDIHSDIIIVPHHGGYAANTKELLDRVDPSYAIVSARFGSPSQDTIDACSERARLYRTGRRGAVTAAMDGSGIRVWGFRD